MKVALLSCTSTKKEYPCTAAEMYLPSPRFALAFEYAKQVADVVYILSAKYGLLSENAMIEPYNETLRVKSKGERSTWSTEVLKSLDEKCSLEEDEFIILTGRMYNELLIPSLKWYTLPLEGQSMGMWIPKLRELINLNLLSNMETGPSSSLLIHNWLINLPRYNWEKINDMPYDNGIYIMFETGETLYDKDRIVRVGTHRANGRLKKRLRDHFLRENKDGSILRKNIGLALLHREGNPFEAIWALDWSKPEVKAQYIDDSYFVNKKKVEGLVSAYLKNSFSFTCILVDDKTERLRIEEALIATLNRSVEFMSSPHWLGCYSPKPEIASSGLWNTQGLNGKTLTYLEVESLKAYVMNGIQNSTNEFLFRGKKNEKSSLKIKGHKNQEYIEGLSFNTTDIKAHIQGIIDNARMEGLEFVDIVSGEIHKQLKLSSKMPSVCSAMYQLMSEKDLVLHTTPSGKSSTIRIRYYLF